MKGQRLESVRVVVDRLLLGMKDADERRNAYCHLYGVSQTAAALALKRGLDPEIAAITGMLHDIYSYHTGIFDFHGQNSAEMARPILRDMTVFMGEERKTIVSALYHHSDKKGVHGPYDEVLKDADVLQHYLYNVDFKVFPHEARRLDKILTGLNIPKMYEIGARYDAKEKADRKDRYTLLADSAERLAAKKIEGVESDADYRSICRPWPDDNIYKVLRNNWCAAFVYYCCKEAGFLLPIRHPLCSHRFAGVGAWLQWASLPDIGFFHPFGEDGFVPQRGDIVIYEKIISEKSHDHIGIVLSVDGGEMMVAEGNAYDKNISSAVKRSTAEHINGFIHIDNSFTYEYTDTFNWEV